MEYSDEYIEKFLDSIDGCLSISVNSCETCIYKEVHHPHCKNMLVSKARDIIYYLKEKKEAQKNDN